MPRTARAAVGGVCYHVMNRGNGGMRTFDADGDYAAFFGRFAPAGERLPMRILAYNLMPNHFHLVLLPYGDGDLGRWMQWLLTSHVRRFHRHHGTSGHVWHGRFKAFPIEENEHLLTVLRYVERNPVRAGLIERAEDWPWSSAHTRPDGTKPAFLAPSPVPRPENWSELLALTEAEAMLDRLRRCANRQTPFGSEAWVIATAKALGLESTLRPRGRPLRRQL